VLDYFAVGAKNGSVQKVGFPPSLSNEF
jgi:hypothetical protein